MGVRVLGAGGLAGLLLGGQVALGQGITLDGSLGAGGMLTGPVYVIPQGAGTTVGTNLFHSFGRFNLTTGEAASFESAAAIRNILARVTGGSPSSIDGLIFTTSPAVNLFLINPAGITFGPNARLDIGGTVRGGFTATTLDAVVWPGGSRFDAVNPGGPQPLLRIVGDPRGFWASQRQILGIVVDRSGLGVYPNQDLRLLGGAVSLSEGWLKAQDGRVAVGAVTGAGTVGLDSDGWLTVPGTMARGDVRVNGMDIVVAGERGGDVQLVAENLAIANRSAVLGGVVPGTGSPNNHVGDIRLEAMGRVQIEGPGTFIFNYLQPNAIGQGGEVAVQGREIMIRDAILMTTTFGLGNAGEVRLEATDQVLLQDAAILSGTFLSTSGDGAAIRITAPRIDLLDHTFVDAVVESPGRGGTIALRASEQLRIANRSKVSSYVGPDGVGQGGDVILETPKLLIQGGSLLSVGVLGQGQGGRLVINTNQPHRSDSPGLVQIQDSFLAGFVLPQGRGKGGAIAIETGSLQLENSIINAALTGEGQAGSIQITAMDQMSLRNASIFTLVSDEGTGAGGNVDLTVGSLLMDQESLVSTRTLGQGDAGDVGIRAIAGPRPLQTGAVVIDGRLDGVTGLFSGVSAGAIGQGGDVTVEAQSLTLQNGQINAGTRGQGAAGNVRIEVVDRVSMNIDLTEWAVEEVGSRNAERGTSTALLPTPYPLPPSNFPLEADSILITPDGQVHLVATQPGTVALQSVNCDRKV